MKKFIEMVQAEIEKSFNAYRVLTEGDIWVMVMQSAVFGAYVDYMHEDGKVVGATESKFYKYLAVYNVARKRQLIAEALETNGLGLEEIQKRMKNIYSVMMSRKYFERKEVKAMEKKCACGQPAHRQLGSYCEECFFNVAIDDANGGDYYTVMGEVVLRGGEKFVK